VSESRQPPDAPVPGAPAPTLQRPITEPSGIHVAPPVQPQPGQPSPTGTSPPPPMHPSAPYPAAAPVANPYQSQVVPPAAFTQTGPQYPQGQGQAPVAPGSAPRLGGNTGTIPAMASPLNAAPRTTGGYPAVSLPRITVQYPQTGSTLKSSRGNYQVTDVIGAGEFGAVYECIGPFDQIYAVKMVRPANRPYSEVHAEWAREVQRLFLLRHPNVAYIYDSFTQDHLFFLALERCDHALKAMLGAPMQEGLVIEMTRQTLAAVQFLHDNDVVHDDLHAGNVLITHLDRPTVKISDFGISHELRGMPAVRPNVVHHAIMAPEIIATGYTSKQSDLYQVGLLIYWMLVGEPAIQMDVPYQELVRQVSDGEPRKRAEQLGTPLGNLIAKMLRRREAFRYTSAREVWADLRELPAWKQRQLFPAR
jgi:eukaryotic-like serine/threonine-protein kinase